MNENQWWYVSRDFRQGSWELLQRSRGRLRASGSQERGSCERSAEVWGSATALRSLGRTGRGSRDEALTMGKQGSGVGDEAVVDAEGVVSAGLTTVSSRQTRSVLITGPGRPGEDEELPGVTLAKVGPPG